MNEILANQEIAKKLIEVSEEVTKMLPTQTVAYVLVYGDYISVTVGDTEYIKDWEGNWNVKSVSGI